MSRQEKLVDRLRSNPSDFTWDELKRLLAGFGYREMRGRGSRRKFIGADGDIISLHQPHPRNILRVYQVSEIVAHLKQEGHL